MMSDRLLDRRQVAAMTSLSLPTIYRAIGAGSFPRPVKISANRVAWPASAVDAWLKSKMEAAA